MRSPSPPGVASLAGPSTEGGSDRRRSCNQSIAGRQRSSSRHRSTSRQRYRRHHGKRDRLHRSRSRSRHRSHRRRRHYSRSRSRHQSRDRRSHRRSRSPKVPPPPSSRRSPSTSSGPDEAEEAAPNAFKNDGSFMEMFKKMQEEKEKEAQAQQPAMNLLELYKGQVAAAPPAPMIGKRRGGRILKTGMVEKPKPPEEATPVKRDAWSLYLEEVKKYKEACCEEDSKTRLLVK